jgi:ABC-2 type transport system ATP-binding protein
LRSSEPLARFARVADAELALTATRRMQPRPSRARMTNPSTTEFGAPIAVLEGVSQRFGAFAALEDVHLTVCQGDVYGLLGLNGAGKTTSLRILLRLLHPTAGRVELFGQPIEQAWLEIVARIGAMIEAPAFYPHLDGRTNLSLLYDLAGAPTGRDPDAALAAVGLSDAAGVRARNYSQGMLQRLYLAQALLGSPQLLVLDEPTSNLDPRGILDVRQLIQKLCREEGRTVILSSHQLSEVEGLCNRVGILHKGRRLIETEVVQLFGAEERWLEIELDRPEKALEQLRTLPWCSDAELRDGRVRARVPRARRAELNARLVAEGFAVSELVERQPRLEDYFHQITADASVARGDGR